MPSSASDRPRRHARRHRGHLAPSRSRGVPSVAGPPRRNSTRAGRGFSLPGRLRYHAVTPWHGSSRPTRPRWASTTSPRVCSAPRRRIDLPLSLARRSAARGPPTSGPARGARRTFVSPSAARWWRSIRSSREPAARPQRTDGRGWLVRVRCDDARRRPAQPALGRLAETWMRTLATSSIRADRESQSWTCRDGGDWRRATGEARPRDVEELTTMFFLT